MDFNGNFRRHGEVNTTGIRHRVMEMTNADWRSDSFRQKQFAVHSDTETIYLIFDRDFRHVDPTIHKAFEDVSECVVPVFNTLKAVFGSGGVIRCLLTRLKAGGHISAHRDHGFSLQHSHRVHVPIMTAPEVMFVVGGEPRHLSAGEVWEINNCRTHEVFNRSAIARVHMIVDWAPAMTEAERRQYAEERTSVSATLKAGGTLKYD